MKFSVYRDNLLRSGQANSEQLQAEAWIYPELRWVWIQFDVVCFTASLLYCHCRPLWEGAMRWRSVSVSGIF